MFSFYAKQVKEVEYTIHYKYVILVSAGMQICSWSDTYNRISSMCSMYALLETKGPFFCKSKISIELIFVHELNELP